MNPSTDSLDASIAPLGSDEACRPTHEQIALCAYFIYEFEGRPSGRDIEHWLQAEEQLVLCCLHEAARTRAAG